MAIDWKTIISEFDGKPTLLQAIGKLRKAVEDETITIQQAQAEIAKLESQQKADEALITTADTKAQAADTKAQEALDLATTNKALIIDKVDKITGENEYIRIYGVSKDGIQTTYEASETDVPWKIVRRDKSGSFDIPEATKNTQPVRKDTFDLKLSQKQDKIKDTTNIDARYISAVSAFRKVTLVGSTKTYSVINFENGREAGGDIYVLTRGNTKTLFGNKSLYGTGNIDLYKHHIVLTSNGEKGFFDFYSSKNTKCVSLADLKTLLGNTFEVEVCGQYSFRDSGDNDRFYRYAYITETAIFVEKVHTAQSGDLDSNYPTIGTDSNVTWAGITITDTVTTI